LYNLKDDIDESVELSTREPARFAAMQARLQQLYQEVRTESPTWPAWTWPRLEGKRIKSFRDLLKKNAASTK